MSKVKDEDLAEQGKLKLDWAEDHMPVLQQIRKRFKKEKPLEGISIGACLHVTKETGILMRTLKAGGADVYLCGSNPLSTQDDVAAQLAEDGINVFAWRGVSEEKYYWCVNKVLDGKPKITMDDGGDLIATLHSKRKDLIPNVLGGTEETTTGVIRFRAMEKDKVLKFPVVAVNDAMTKHLFDNRYGTGQSTIDGILRATSVMITGSNFVVAGYGWCSRGIAMRAKGMGARVFVTEVDPVKALEAAMDGFTVMKMSEASKIGDIFVTATGDKDIITKEHFKNMKNGAVLANSGHFNNEINIEELENLSKNSREIRNNTREYTLKDGKKIYLLAEGRLVNLAAAEGHPCEVMDMSFANQSLMAEYILNNHSKMDPKVYSVPRKIDERIAEMKLKTMGMEIDELSKEQKKYLSSWEEGT
ncbi:MAG: adenosylhomocysteinase [Candidatus Undinarchaeales archaeon]